MDQSKNLKILGKTFKNKRQSQNQGTKRAVEKLTRHRSRLSKNPLLRGGHSIVPREVVTKAEVYDVKSRPEF